MEREGPPLEALVRRLAECPADFLAEPRIGTTGAVHVEAVVSDLVRALGGSGLTREQAALFVSTDPRRDRNRLRLALVASWLLYDEWFRRQASLGAPALQFLSGGTAELAALVQAPRAVSDPDRREELARLCLKSLGYRPAGESIAQAEDRLATLNSVERERVVRAARAAEERARKVREEMARKAAYDASMKAMRE